MNTHLNVCNPMINIFYFGLRWCSLAWLIVNLLLHCTTVFSKTSSFIDMSEKPKIPQTWNEMTDLSGFAIGIENNTTVVWTHSVHTVILWPVVNTKAQRLVPKHKKHNQGPGPRHVIQFVLTLQLFTDHSWPDELGWSHPDGLITSGWRWLTVSDGILWGTSGML